MRTLLVHDEEEPCPYLPGETARMPLHLPVQPPAREAFDRLLELGMRRSGPLLYRTQCPRCHACEPIRVEVSRFRPSRTQRRAWRRNQDVDVALLSPQLTPRHLVLYNRHKLERGLSLTGSASSARDYRQHLLETCADTREVQYRLDGELVAVSILDFGRESVSAVYHFFDPDQEARSIGVFARLAEFDLARRHGLRWFYLGLYVANCASLAYKSAYRPHQRLIEGVWTDFAE